MVIILPSGCQPIKSTEPKVVGYLDCKWFYSRYEREKMLERENCGTIDENNFVQVDQEVIDLMDFSGSKAYRKAHENLKYPREHPDNLHCIMTNTLSGDYGGMTYIHEEGHGRIATMFDNSCWPFSNNVSFGYIDGKVTYFNTELEIVKYTNYPFAWGRTVCSEKPIARYGPHKEHNTWMGGKCGQLNNELEIAKPVDQPFEEFHPLPEWAIPFYSRNSNIIAKLGKGEELVLLLTKAYEKIPGMRRYEVGQNIHNPELVHISERWESRAAYTASLDLPQIQNAIANSSKLIETTNNLRDYEYDPENDKY